MILTQRVMKECLSTICYKLKSKSEKVPILHLRSLLRRLRTSVLLGDWTQSESVSLMRARILTNKEGISRKKIMKRQQALQTHKLWFSRTFVHVRHGNHRVNSLNFIRYIQNQQQTPTMATQRQVYSTISKLCKPMLPWKQKHHIYLNLILIP